MDKLSPRERLICVLSGGIPDRVPVSFFVQEDFLSYVYPDTKSIDRVVDAVRCARWLGFDVMTRSNKFVEPYFLKNSFINWEVNKYARVSNGNTYYICEIKTPVKTLKQVRVLQNDCTATVSSTTEYLIKDEDDFEVFIKYMPFLDKRIIDEMKEFGDFSKGVIGDCGISVPWAWGGVYNQASRLRKLEDLLMDPYINSDFYKYFMTKLTDLIVLYNTLLAKYNKDCIGITGNIANGAIMSKEFFDTNVLPYEKKLVSEIKRETPFVLYHNCGYAKNLLESYADMGITAWETVSESPQGDNDLNDAKRRVGDKIVLIGNIDQVHFLKEASMDEIINKVKKTMEICKPGGYYIFSGSDYLERNTPIDNIKTAIKAAKEYGM